MNERIDESDSNNHTQSQRPNKRSRLSTSNDNQIRNDDIISPKVLENVEGLSKSYRINTKPYPHGFVEDIFVDGFLGKHSLYLSCIMHCLVLLNDPLF